MDCRDDRQTLDYSVSGTWKTVSWKLNVCCNIKESNWRRLEWYASINPLNAELEV